MALTVKTEITDTLNEHYISDYSAFLDDDNDFYLIDNDSGDFIVQLNDSGCRVFEVPAGIDTIEDFLTVTFSKNTHLKRVYGNNSGGYNITVEAN